MLAPPPAFPLFLPAEFALASQTSFPLLFCLSLHHARLHAQLCMRPHVAPAVCSMTTMTTNIIRSVVDPSQRENLGIIVQYKVKVKLCLGALGG